MGRADRSIDKTELRHRARAARRSLGATRRALDEARYDRIVAAGLMDGVAVVAAYVADDGEADPLPWCHVADGRRVVLPVAETGSASLRFYVASAPEQLVPGRWGIPEPPRDELVGLADVDVVLVPLVVFDALGGRLGRGGGFYDATVGPGAGLHHRPRLVGVAYDEQEVPVVPTHPHDLRLDVVATPTRLLWCR